MEPGEFRRYAELARDAWTLRQRVGDEGPTANDPRLGEPVKRVQDCERDVRTVSRQSIVARRALEAGATISEADLTFKRPGTGIPPWRLSEVVGRRAARAVEADMPLTEGDIR